jgi:hypothetical protein
MSKYPVAILASALAILALADAAPHERPGFLTPQHRQTPKPAPIILVGDVEVSGNMIASGGVVGASGYFTGDVRTAGSLLTNSTTTGIGYAQTAGGSVIQTGAATNSVTLNRPCGSIRTVPVFIPPGGVVTFNLFSSCIAHSDVVNVCVQAYAGGGLPAADITLTFDGGCGITLKNLSSTMPVNNVVFLNVALVKAVDY